MKCGFFELDITPALGSIIPGSFEARYSDTVRDTLFVRAFVCLHNGKNAAIVSVDCVGITADITERIRSRVASMTPIKRREIMVMATHCHAGGPTLNWGEEVVRNEFYIQNLVDKAADSIIVAYQRAERVELKKGTEHLCDVSFIRVFKMKDGSFKTNPGAENANKIDCPCSEIDDDVLVLTANRNGAPIGAIVNFALHPAIVAANETSGDYISSLSREMKKVCGPDFVTVFINGACGDINHINTSDYATSTKPGRDRYIGRKLSEKVLSAIQNSQAFSGNIDVSEKEISVRLRKPTAEQLLQSKEILDVLGDELTECVLAKGKDYVDVFFAMQALQIQADKNTQRSVYLQIIKIGDVSVFGIPCQIFVNYGKKIKAACGVGCMISAFANDYCGYVPTKECMKKGVYEATLAPTSALEANTGDKICDAIIEMYRTIK
ncbi:MAG: neutral/alkaline non-lysosomal ceramidase N-terminal domain-containing protein [Clostridiaceae bacterium]|nr:neutral/alkaline non-lysosomal ceramidase N-terminal domain-containing protein [Clostridiaceae bacterium]